MKMTIRSSLALLALAAGPAAAGDKDKADALFKQGKKLMAEKHYADACAAFEQSFALDPGIGGELNIARCYEEWGKIGRAYKAYQQAEDMATKANDPRAPKIHELVVGLEPKVPHVTIKLPKGATAKMEATLDGAPLDVGPVGASHVVDPGPHTIEYTVDGAKKKKVIAVERGGSVDVVLEGVVKDTAKPEGEGEDVHQAPPPPSNTGRTQRIAGIATGGAGVVMMGIASYMTLSAKSKYDDALKAHCMGMTNACDDIGLRDTHDARSQANVATVVFLIGGAAVGGGVALYLLAPRPMREEHALYLVPSVHPDGGGLVFGGRY